jgi:hypothetical protein
VIKKSVIECPGLLHFSINKKEKKKDDDVLGGGFGCGLTAFLQGFQQPYRHVDKDLDNNGSIAVFLYLII